MDESNKEPRMGSAFIGITSQWWLHSPSQTKGEKGEIEHSAIIAHDDKA